MGPLVIEADVKEYKTKADTMGMSQLMMNPESPRKFMVQRGSKVLTIQSKEVGVGRWDELGGCTIRPPDCLVLHDRHPPVEWDQGCAVAYANGPSK